jgi:hypothetical protein
MLSPFSSEGRNYYRRKYLFDVKTRAKAFKHWEFYSNATYMWEDCIADLDWKNYDVAYRPKETNTSKSSSVFALTKL